MKIESTNMSSTEPDHKKEFIRLLKEYEALNKLEKEMQVRIKADSQNLEEFRNPEDILEEIENVDRETDALGHTNLVISNILKSGQLGNSLVDSQAAGAMSEELQLKIDKIAEASREVFELGESVRVKEEKIRDLRTDIKDKIEKRNRVIEAIKSVNSGAAGQASEYLDELQRCNEQYRKVRGNYNFLRFFLQHLLTAGEADFVKKPKLADLLVQCGEELEEEED